MAVLFSAVPAQAMPPVEVPSECGSQAEFDAELRRIAGEAALERAPSAIAIVPLEADAAYRLDVTTPEGTRSVVDRDCRALFRSAIVIAAARAGDEAEAEAPAPGAGPTTTSELSPPPAAAPSDQRTTASRTQVSGVNTRAQPRGHGLFFAGAGLAAWSGPKPNVRVELGGAYLPGRWEVAALAFYVAPSTRDADAAHGVEVSSFGLQARAGYRPLPWLALRLGPELARQVGRGRGEGRRSRDGALRLGLIAEASGVLVAAGGLWLELALAGRYAVTRPSFEIEGFGTIYRTPALSGDAVFRLGVQFP